LEWNDRIFSERLALLTIGSVRKVVPMKDIVKIKSIVWMPQDVVFYFIRRIKTLDGSLPFENAKISSMNMVPDILKIGQKFVYREKYSRLLEGMSGVFRNFLFVPSFTDLGAYFVFGASSDGEFSVACYFPPIIERHGTDFAIIDGIHRNYIAKQTGKSSSLLLIENVTVPFPCDLRTWDEVRVISETNKPKDIRDRFFGLRQELFRDFKYLGIDG
jgi:hypothetical protein